MTRPACMTTDEFAAWEEANRSVRGMGKAESPCRDCVPLFHADMVAGGQCDGVPLAGDRAAAKPGRKFATETDRRTYWTEHRRASRARAAV